MRRLLLILVLAAACLALLATPALAYQSPPTYEPGTAYVPLRAELWGDNFWFEFDGDGNLDMHDADATPIPHDYDICLQLGFTSPTRGQVENIPKSILYTLTLDGPGYHWSSDTASSKELWSTMFSWGPGSAFNREFATFWERDLYKVLSDLPPGDYSGTTTEIVTHTLNDLSFYGELWSRHAQQKPVKIPAGTNDYTFAFTVASVD